MFQNFQFWILCPWNFLQKIFYICNTLTFTNYYALNHPFLLFVSRLSCSESSRCIPKRTINFETLVGGGGRVERSEPLSRLQRTCYRLLKLEELPAERGGGSLRGLCTCVHDSKGRKEFHPEECGGGSSSANLITLMRDRTRKSR